MIRLDLRLGIASSVIKGERSTTAVTIVFEPDRISGSPLVLLVWPGGGYNRSYFDLRLPGRIGYSQAEYHAERGSIFVACNHIGTGGSSIPDVTLNHSDIARVSAETARIVSAKLQAGDLNDRLPPFPDLFPIGMGQSYGGLLLTHLQAEHGIFGGVAILGWSGICTEVKNSSGTENVPSPAEMQGTDVANNGLLHPYRRSFHFDDVPEDIVAEDLRGYPARIGVPIPRWSTEFMPGGPNFSPERNPLGPNVVVDEAAKISVPVFIGNGEVDTVPDRRAEPAAYRQSPDITTFVLPRSSHMHNFAGTREMLWSRLDGWVCSIKANWRASSGWYDRM